MILCNRLVRVEIKWGGDDNEKGKQMDCRTLTLEEPSNSYSVARETANKFL